MTMSDESSAEERNPMEILETAVQDFVRAIADEDEPIWLVRGFVLSWEQVRFDEDGDALWRTRYAVPEITTAAHAVGILTVTKALIEEMMIGRCCDHE